MLFPRTRASRLAAPAVVTLALAVAGSLTAVGAPARAQTQDVAAKADAETLLQKGARAFSAGDYARALDQFLEARRRFPSPEIEFDIGLAETRLEHHAEALQAFDRYVASGVADPENLVNAKALSASLLPKVAVVHVEGPPKGAELLVDGKPWGTTPLTTPLYAAPGKRVLTARLAGFQPATSSFEAVAGKKLGIELTLLPLTLAAKGAGTPPGTVAPSPGTSVATVSEAPATQKPPQDERHTTRWLVLGAVGVAVAGTLAAVLLLDRSPTYPSDPTLGQGHYPSGVRF